MATDSEEMWQTMTDQQSEREAHLIQCVGELGRGLDILQRELRVGDFRSASDSVVLLRVTVQTMDAVLAGRDA